ncbi:DUF2934 domain-containing protein [Tabrizicola sp.]|uniref:DUF2934 domain-containing protein n=1 Tax=Tabrizicola sp. TaxID=2005166 RepID=UPI002735CB0D|nr:DUF2934 domain-containing protein [Tabrizicola sp.]MDP3194502.1 DUF2934 domain-containing protein [Tabrizicola sp.]
MNRQEFDAWENRIRDRADQLWVEAGRPDGGRDRYLDAARELLAMHEVRPPTLDPEDTAKPVIEEASIQGNLGEFPTLTDQGEEQTYPHAREDDGPRLSDGDASEDGGVLPQDEEPDEDHFEVSEAESDVTSSSVNAEDDPENPDLNDDGMPDPKDLDEDVEGEMPPGDEYQDSAPPR